MNARRLAKKARARAEQRRRAAIKRMSCDPRRLWPLDSVQRQDFEVAHCGDFARVLKWLYGGRDRFLGKPDTIEALWYDRSPLWGLIPKAAVLA